LSISRCGVSKVRPRPLSETGAAVPFEHCETEYRRTVDSQIMMTSRWGFVLLLALVLSVSRPPVAHAQRQHAPPVSADQPRAGFPIAETRRRAIAADDFHRKLDAATVRKWMELSSKCTMAEFELFLAPLSPQEERLLQAVQRTPAPIVNRLHFAHLQGVLKNGGIVALELENAARHAQIPHTTPAVENELFGAFDCVFASVGPAYGSSRYGDVIIRLKDSVREHGWA